MRLCDGEQLNAHPADAHLPVVEGEKSLSTPGNDRAKLAA
jgi:hypothetical protein